MNRKNVDDSRYVDLDEFLILEIVELPIVLNEGEKLVQKKYFTVDGITKTGLKVEQLYLDTKSGVNTACVKFITDFWLSAKK